ncbi:hypothetical protein ABPG75_008946 [Micractinium tetrahymenae]
MSSRAFLALLLGALMIAGSFSSAAAMSGNEERQAKRQKCYERCLKRYGWKPVCVFSPRYLKPTSHMPEARWVMPNFCTMKCQERYAKYQEYFKLETRKFAKVPAYCKKDVQAIYFDWSKESPKCTRC